jgi:hypothetical protein
VKDEKDEIPRDHIDGEAPPAEGLGTEIAALFSEVGLDAAIPELRGHEISPIDFRRIIARRR